MIGSSINKGKIMNTKLKQAVMAALTSAALFGYGANAMADTTNDLVRALIEKGVLTEEEAKPLMVKTPYYKDDPALAIAKNKVGGKINVRGYLQVRNTTMLGGDEGINLWSDRSVGDDRSVGSADKNFLIRRARVILFGDVGERLYYYLQPDFASSAGSTGNIAQLRDAYGDVYLTKDKVHRIRVGQSKVPYGFENLQSSQNRLALDRVDALNSAVRDERDLGAFYYYTPLETQALFQEIAKKGLKHSGNYGQFGIGAYNGQGANRGDQNDNYHIVARYTHPWKTESGQIYEAGIQGYRGQYVVASTGSYTVNRATRAAPSLAQGVNGFKDERVGVSFMMYPQPFGIMAEWNWGTTPGLDVATNTIREQSLNGGYVQAMYQIENFKFFDTNGTLIPFIKWQYFDGANKAETNAPQNHVNDWEVGAEWQIAPEVELVAYYHKMKRSNLVTGTINPNVKARSSYESFDADALRVQLQYNF